MRLYIGILIYAFPPPQCLPPRLSVIDQIWPPIFFLQEMESIFQLLESELATLAIRRRDKWPVWLPSFSALVASMVTLWNTDILGISWASLLKDDGLPGVRHQWKESPSLPIHPNSPSWHLRHMNEVIWDEPAPASLPAGFKIMS